MKPRNARHLRTIECVESCWSAALWWKVKFRHWKIPPFYLNDIRHRSTAPGCRRYPPMLSYLENASQRRQDYRINKEEIEYFRKDNSA